MRNPLHDLLYDDNASPSYHYDEATIQNPKHNSITDMENTDMDSTDISSAAYDSLPTNIQEALLQQKRLVIIANNPSITIERLEQTLQPTDIVVLFNHFIHADFFANHPLAKNLPKLLFFRQIGDSKLHFGLPPRRNNLLAIEQMAQQAHLGILVSNIRYQLPTLADDPSPNDDPITADRVLKLNSDLKTLFDSAEQCRVLSEQHPVVSDYPSFADIHSSAPTSGFLIYRLLVAARRQVLQLQAEQSPSPTALEIMMIGFNDEDKTAHFWEGHNWKFERQELINPPIGVQIIRQY